MKASDLFVYRCEMDLGLTYAMRRPMVAVDCFSRALFAAHAANRPDLAFRANELLSLVSV